VIVFVVRDRGGGILVFVDRVRDRGDPGFEKDKGRDRGRSKDVLVVGEMPCS
jgi:hypothetical protein